MSKKSTTSTTSDGTTHLTTTPTNPEFVTRGIGDLSGSILDLSKSDPYQYVAGPDPLQTKAGATAGGLNGSPWNFDGAADLMRGVAGAGANTYDPFTVKAASVLDNLPAYMSPYTNDVVDTTLKGYDQNSNQVRQGQALDLAGDSTFGGSGGSILRALTEGQLGMGRAQTEAGLRDRAFTTGAGLASGDADRKTSTRLADMAAINSAGQFNAGQHDLDLQRRLAAAGGLAGLSTAADANTRANAETQAGIGGSLRDITQAHDSAPLTLAALTSGLFGSLPLNLLHGQTADGTTHTTGTGTSTESDPIGQLSKLLAAIGSLGGGGGGGSGGSGSGASAAAGG